MYKSDTYLLRFIPKCFLFDIIIDGIALLNFKLHLIIAARKKETYVLMLYTVAFHTNLCVLGDCHFC
jgi:hypothetical protein